MQPTADVEFDFVEDQKVRAVIQDYWQQAQSALEAEAYAGVVVLCGGVLEGLLAWALTTREHQARDRFPDYFINKDGTDKPLTVWDLTSLINVASKLELIGATSERLLRAVQQFRNFIHPYNVVRQSARPNARLSTIAHETVGEVVRSLKGRLES